MNIPFLAELLELVVLSFPDLQGCPLRVSMKTWQDVCSALTKALISKVLTPAGFKWPLMALEACSGSGSLKLGEALYETLLHLSPLLLPVTAYAYRPHNLKPLEQQGKLLEWHWKSNTGLWNHLKFQAGRHLCALYQYILLISQWDCLGD